MLNYFYIFFFGGECCFPAPWGPLSPLVPWHTTGWEETRDAPERWGSISGLCSCPEQGGRGEASKLGGASAAHLCLEPGFQPHQRLSAQPPAPAKGFPTRGMLGREMEQMEGLEEHRGAARREQATGTLADGRARRKGLASSCRGLVLPLPAPGRGSKPSPWQQAAVPKIARRYPKVTEPLPRAVSAVYCIYWLRSFKREERK